MNKIHNSFAALAAANGTVAYQTNSVVTNNFASKLTDADMADFRKVKYADPEHLAYMKEKWGTDPKDLSHTPLVWNGQFTRIIQENRGGSYALYARDGDNWSFQSDSHSFEILQEEAEKLEDEYDASFRREDEAAFQRALGN